MGYDGVEQVREGLLGDGLEGNFWDAWLFPYLNVSSWAPGSGLHVPESQTFEA